MDKGKEHSRLATLEMQRRILLRKLAQIGHQIDQTGQAQARLEERIQILEQRQPQAA